MSAWVTKVVRGYKIRNRAFTLLLETPAVFSAFHINASRNLAETLQTANIALSQISYLVHDNS